MDRAVNNGGGVGVYMRVSSQDQKRRGTIETQRPDLERYLAAFGYSPYGWYEDEAVSGHWVPFGERPQGKRLLADARAGHVALVLVWRLDRFGRNAYEMLGAVKELEAAGARLVSLHEKFDTGTAAGKLMLGVLAAVAEFEWESIMERSEAGVVRKLDSGGWMGGPAPYGYGALGTKQDARLVPDETPLTLTDGTIMTAADVVRLIYSMMVEGRKTTVAIADELQRRGIPTAYAKRGKRYHRDGQLLTDDEHPATGLWRPNAVNVILSNPVYKGEYTYGRRRAHGAPREIVTCPVAPLVSVETWDAAQAALERNLMFSPRNAKRDYLLRGFMTCGLCGHLYIGDGTKYNCYAHRRPQILWGSTLGKERRCPAPAMNAARIEGQIWADVEEHLRDPERTLRQISIKLRGQEDTGEAIRAELAAKQQEMGAKQDERDTILAYFRKGRISERDLDRQLDDIAREEVRLAKETAALADRLNGLDDVAARLDRAGTLLRRLRTRLDSEPMTPALRREIIEALIDRIVVRPLPPDDPNDPTGASRAVASVTYTFDDAPASVLSTVSRGDINDNMPTHAGSRDRDWRSSGTAWGHGRGSARCAHESRG